MANRPLSQKMNSCHGLGHMLVAQDKSVLDVSPKIVEFPSGHATAGAKPHWPFAIHELWFLAAVITGERAPISQRLHGGRWYAGFTQGKGPPSLNSCMVAGGMLDSASELATVAA